MLTPTSPKVLRLIAVVIAVSVYGCGDGESPVSPPGPSEGAQLAGAWQLTSFVGVYFLARSGRLEPQRMLE